MNQPTKIYRAGDYPACMGELLLRKNRLPVPDDLRKEVARVFPESMWEDRRDDVRPSLYLTGNWRFVPLGPYSQSRQEVKDTLNRLLPYIYAGYVDLCGNCGEGSGMTVRLEYDPETKGWKSYEICKFVDLYDVVFDAEDADWLKKKLKASGSVRAGRLLHQLFGRMEWNEF